MKILKSVGLVTVFGGFVADWNRTHLFNPNWPPHARFHDAMTILLGTFAGLGSLHFLRRAPHPSEQDLAIAAALPSAFFLSQTLSFAFPGAKGLDAEFPDALPKIGRVQINEFHISLAILAITAVGYSMARRERSAPRPRRP
ncbi:DUF6640 family protein [Roseomonas chloroacetimidivorans]|uniref:DUF6640 family protein n=1 Tax=Roseomonas chloroacetimidivorans TaxID=1766656 RepID=UPI003C78EBD6